MCLGRTRFWSVIQSAVVLLFCFPPYTRAQTIEAARGGPIRPLANDYVEVFRSADPKHIFCYSPGITRCPSGRLIATTDLGGPGVEALPGSAKYSTWFCKGLISSSDDGGKTWTERGSFPFVHARPFVAGNHLYILGQRGDLMVIRSDDWGQSWSKPVTLTQGQRWHQAPSNVIFANGNVYLVMERRVYDDVHEWPVSIMAPVLMRAKVDDDLTSRASWTFASELVFRDAVPEDQLNYFGIPFYQADPHEDTRIEGNKKVAPTGWCETNVVQIVDPDHYWFDPTGHTFHLIMRANTGGTNVAALAKVAENKDGTMTTSLVHAPSGRTMAFLPLPGGEMKFHILYDEQTKLYWLLSSQTTDSMTRADRLPEGRTGIPNQERNRLQLHYSKNCVDWVFAGLVAEGKTPRESRNYASMVIDGNDLVVLSRSGDTQAKSAHDGDLITFHRVVDFRSLIY